MNVTIIGHSYLADENRKSLTALSKYINLQVISPNKFSGMIFNYDFKQKSIKQGNWEIILKKKFGLFFFPEAVYFLKTFSFGFIKFKPDVVHVELDPFHPLFFQVILSKFIFAPRAKIIATIKQNTYTSRGFFMDFLKDCIAKFIDNFIHSYICVNEGVEKLYIEKFRINREKFNQSTHIGVDTNLFKPNQKLHNKFKIGYCGRIIAYKGIWDLIDAVELINNNRDPKDYILLDLLGDGPEVNKLNLLCKKFSWLTYLNPIPHNKVPYFLNSLDLFVMPSRILKEHVEHDSHAVLEAMSSGLPCIVAKSGSNIEVLKDIGVLIDPEKIDLLKNEILKLINNSKLRNKLSVLGRKRVIERYSLEAVAKKYFKTYNEE